MIPKNSNINIEVEEQPSKTYKIIDDNKVSGVIYNKESVKQAIKLILSTERYQYLIYSWQYGFESADLIGKPRSYVYPELKRRVKEALTQDGRITDVGNFKFKHKGENVTVSFTASTIYGQVSEEVSINV